MRLSEITMYEARQNHMPAYTPGYGEGSTWYALEDDEGYKGFMEITRIEGEDISEISYFMIPDIHRGNGYGALMLELFLEKYIPGSGAGDLLTAAFDYNDDHGRDLERLLSEHGFDISFRSFKECYLPFEDVYKKLAQKKDSAFNSVMMKLSDGLETAYRGLADLEDCDITLRDVAEADGELSVMAADEEGNLMALLLVSADESSGEAVITDLFVDSDDKWMLRAILSFAVENANNSTRKPQSISFAAVNEKLEKVMTSLLDPAETSTVVLADAEFNLGKYLEQLNITDSIRRK